MCLRRYPEVDFLLEGTLHHLGLSHDMNLGQLAKVNPPIRSREDVEFLWKSVLDGTIKTVVSDHACVTKEIKKGDLWTSLPGFGGTSLMFPVLITEGYHKRGLPLQRIAELSSANPARSHDLYPRKGAIKVGSDADFAIVDIQTEKQVTLANLFTAQDFSPEEGMKLKGWPEVHGLEREGDLRERQSGWKAGIWPVPEETREASLQRLSPSIHKFTNEFIPSGLSAE